MGYHSRGWAGCIIDTTGSRLPEEIVQFWLDVCTRRNQCLRCCLKPSVIPFRAAGLDHSALPNSPASPRVRPESSSDLLLSTDSGDDPFVGRRAGTVGRAANVVLSGPVGGSFSGKSG